MHNAISYTTHEDIWSLNVIRFLESVGNTDTSNLCKAFTIANSIDGIIAKTRQLLSESFSDYNVKITGHTNTMSIIDLQSQGKGGAIIKIKSLIDNDYSAVRRFKFHVHIVGTFNLAKKLYDRFDEEFGKEHMPTITWLYMRDGTQDETDIVIDTPTEVHDEFYPWIKGGVSKFIDDYFKSSASLLFLLGPPGTGKTSLLRHFIYTKKLNATLTYDETLLQSDSMFVSFMAGGTSDALVIEDADTMLASREHSANKMMNRFLNVSDGLIKFPDKKIIFTTNLSDSTQIDPALLRPGRCFAAVMFRPLNMAEQIKLADKMGKSDYVPKDSATLAQFFNPNQHNTVEYRRVGF
jgi:hypothetical protein